MSEETLAGALAKVQTELDTVGKGKTADAGQYSYQYADLASVARVVYPLLGKHGLAFVSAPRYSAGRYVLVGQLEHVSGERRVGVFPLNDRATPQQIGSALTYGRRYLLGCLTGVVTEEDDDGKAAAQAPAQQERRQQRRKQPVAVPDIREPLWADIKTARERKGWSSDDVAQDFALWSKTDQLPEGKKLMQTDQLPEGKKLMQATADELQAYLLTLTGEPA